MVQLLSLLRCKKLLKRFVVQGLPVVRRVVHFGLVWVQTIDVPLHMGVILLASRLSHL